jgi:hypothetical protein
MCNSINIDYFLFPGHQNCDGQQKEEHKQTHTKKLEHFDFLLSEVLRCEATAVRRSLDTKMPVERCDYMPFGFGRDSRPASQVALGCGCWLDLGWRVSSR